MSLVVAGLTTTLGAEAAATAGSLGTGSGGAGA